MSAESWGDRALSGVDIRYKWRRPVIFSINELQPPNMTDYEYDFFHERQAMTDHDEYMNSKKLTENTASSSDGQISQSSRQTCNPHCDKTAATKAAVGTTKCIISKSSLPSFPSLDDLKPLHQTPPVAASQLKYGQILQPRRTETLTTCNRETDYVKQNIRVNEVLCTAQGQSYHKSAPSLSSIGYLRDFEALLDDPFTNVELTSINDREELKNILLPVPTCTSLHHPLQCNRIQAAVPRMSMASFRGSTNPLNTASPFLQNTPIQGAAPHGFTPKTILNQFSHISTDGQLSTNFGSIRSRNGISNFDYRHLWNPNMWNKSLRSSNPDLQLSDACMNGSMGRNFEPHSAAQCSSQLANWAKSCGLSMYRTHRLTDLNHKNGVPCNNTELHKLLILHQLDAVDTLLKNNAGIGKNGLSEESAILLVTTFPNDLTRAHQLAKAVVEMERSESTPDAIYRYLLSVRNNYSEPLNK